MIKRRIGQGTPVQGIDLNNIAGLFGLVFFRLADRIGPWPGPLPGGEAISWRLPEQPAGLKPGEDAAHHGGGDLTSLSPEQHHQLVLPPAAPLLPQVQHRLGQLREPRGVPPPRRAALGVQSMRPFLYKADRGTLPASLALALDSPRFLKACQQERYRQCSLALALR